MDVPKLCKAIEERPCLWDASQVDYCNRTKVERKWVEVAAIVGASGTYTLEWTTCQNFY